VGEWHQLFFKVVYPARFLAYKTAKNVPFKVIKVAQTHFSKLAILLFVYKFFDHLKLSL
jgi:hypothetical protein